MHNHIQAVPDDEASVPTAGEMLGRERRPSRLRASKALPTDRCKFDIQLQALRSYVTASSRGLNAVSSEDVAARLPITAATTGLLNGFFVEAGFLVKEGRGRYRPSETVVSYAKEYLLDPDRAGAILAGDLGKSWYYNEVDAEFEVAQTVPEDMLITVLARAADAEEHRQQLELVLDWLEYAGLIVRRDGNVELTVAAERPTPAGAKGEKSATEERGETPAKMRAKTSDKTQILAFDFSFSLTDETLHKLSPEQITALFKAIGDVMAIKAGLQQTD